MMKPTKIFIYPTLLFLIIGLVACSISTNTEITSTPIENTLMTPEGDKIGIDENGQNNDFDESDTVEVVVESMPISPTIESIANTFDSQFSNNDVLTPTIVPEEAGVYENTSIHISSIIPDRNWNSHTPENVWWSLDSQTLYFQDETNQQAWMYDVNSDTLEEMLYTPRSASEVAMQIVLPSDASIYGISPQNNYILYTTPIANTSSPSSEANDDPKPIFSHELWTLIDGTPIGIGYVDVCFLLHAPQWSSNENRAIVDTLITSDVPQPCMFNSWLIDLDTFEVGALPNFWVNEVPYRSFSLSLDGKYALIAEAGKDQDYLANLESGEIVAFPNSTGGILIGNEPKFASIVNKFEFTGKDSLTDSYVSHLWLSDFESQETRLLTNLEGQVSQWLVSPNQEYVVIILSPIDGYRAIDKTVPSGIWLVRLS